VGLLVDLGAPRFFEYMAEGLYDAVIEPQDKLMYPMASPLTQI
jgi:hypothetical protein